MADERKTPAALGWPGYLLTKNRKSEPKFTIFSRYTGCFFAFLNYSPYICIKFNRMKENNEQKQRRGGRPRFRRKPGDERSPYERIYMLRPTVKALRELTAAEGDAQMGAAHMVDVLDDLIRLGLYLRENVCGGAEPLSARIDKMIIELEKQKKWQRY